MTSAKETAAAKAILKIADDTYGNDAEEAYRMLLALSVGIGASQGHTVAEIQALVAQCYTHILQ